MSYRGKMFDTQLKGLRMELVKATGECNASTKSVSISVEDSRDVSFTSLIAQANLAGRYEGLRLAENLLSLASGVNPEAFVSSLTLQMRHLSTNLSKPYVPVTCPFTNAWNVEKRNAERAELQRALDRMYIVLN
jgi:hypothetical protein